MLSETDKNNIMDIFFNSCCRIDMLGILSGFSNGIGCIIDDTALVFSDDPDENDPEQMRCYSEMENYNGAGFYSDYFSVPLLVDYQEFYNHLRPVVEKHIANKDASYTQQVVTCLEKIKARYNLD